MKIKINRDIFAGYVIVLSLMVGWYFFFSASNSSILDEYQKEINSELQINEQVQTVVFTGLGNLMSAHSDFLVAPDIASKDVLIANARAVTTEYSKIQSNLAVRNSRRSDAISENLLKYYELIRPVENARSNSEIAQFLAQNAGLNEEMKNYLNLIRADLDALRLGLFRDVHEMAGRISETNEQNFLNYSLYYAGIILLCIIFGIFFSRQVTTSLNAISSGLSSASVSILKNAQSEKDLFNQQSESVDNTALSITELSQFSEQASNNTEEVFTRIEEASLYMKELKKKAEKVGNISTTIEEITHQINILSLNASIEASRAGEQGRGFSAVAQEIRKLAENTRVFTENIRNLTTEIQSYIVNTVDMTYDSVESVKNIKSAVQRQNELTSTIHESITLINIAMKVGVESVQETVESSELVHNFAKQLKDLS